MNTSQDTDKKVRLLFLGRSEQDCDPILRQLRTIETPLLDFRANSCKQFLEVLAREKVDIVFCLDGLVECPAMRALELLRANAPEVPFILISDQVQQIDFLKEQFGAGATDVISQDVTQWVPALLRAMREREERLRRCQLEKALKSHHALLTSQNVELRLSEQCFRQFAENIHEVFWMTDPEKNQIIYISPGYERIWGRSCASLYASPRNWIEAIVPEDQARIMASLPTQVNGTYDEFYRIIRPDGTTRWIHDRAFPIRNEEAEVYRVAGIAEDITQHKLAEQQLEAAEANYRGIFENAVEGMFQTTPEGKFLTANPALASILGFDSPSELIESISDIGEQLCVDPARRLEFRNRLESEGSVQQFDNEIYRKDGMKIWVRINARVVRGVQPDQVHFEGTIQDITARKRAEVQVATLAHAVESNSEMICITDLEDRFTFVNRAFEKAYGYSAAEVLGKTPELLYSPNNPPGLFLEVLRETRAGGWRGEILDRRKDGTELPVFLSTSEIKDTSGRVIGLMGVAQDISERRRREEQIRLLADAVESVNELISITDHENRFTFVNRAFLEAYGYSREEVLGKKPDFLYSKNNAPGLCEEVFRQTMLGRWSGEITNCRKDGTEFPISLSTSMIRSARGTLLGLVGVGRDISERKRAEKQTAAFSWLGYRLSSAASPAQAGEIIMRAASGLFGWDAGYIHLYSQADDKIIPVLTMDTVDGKLVPVQPSTFSLDPSPFMRTVMRYGGRLINRPTQAELARPLVPFGDTARPSASLMFVPIHSRGMILGILSIQSYTPSSYSARDLLLLQALADQCGGAFQRIEVTEALRDSEEKFRTLFESAPIGVALHNASGHYIYTNPAYQRMVGYSDEDLRQLGVRRITHPDDIREGQQLFGDLHTGQSNQYHREKRYVHKSGRLVWAQSSASAIRGSDGKLLYVISMVEDITGRKQVIEALRQSERNLRLIAENTSDVIFAFDMQRRPVYINPSVTELTGYSFAEIQQRQFINWIHPDDQARMLGYWEDLYVGKGYAEVEFRLVTKEGEIKWCSSSWGPLLDEAGRQVGVQGRERDITERKQLEREVLESTANERRRLGHELHDGLGQYLAGIAFRAKALEQTLGSEDDPRAADAKELVGLLSEAISQTRSLARGLDPVDVESIGLPAALQNLAAETSKFFRIDCLLQCPDSTLRIDSHTSLPLYRIVQEALHNGITHGGATRIHIELTSDGDSFCLVVRDNGCGFDRAAVKGNGMGLRVMDYRARSIGAVLRLISQPKAGTEVRCLIPVPKHIPSKAQDEGQASILGLPETRSP